VVNVYYFNIKTLLNVKGFIGYEIYFFKHLHNIAHEQVIADAGKRFTQY